LAPQAELVAAQSDEVREDVARLHVRDVVDAALVEVGRELGEITAVGIEGVVAEPPLDAGPGEELIDGDVDVHLARSPARQPSSASRSRESASGPSGPVASRMT